MGLRVGDYPKASSGTGSAYDNAGTASFMVCGLARHVGTTLDQVRTTLSDYNSDEAL